MKNHAVTGIVVVLIGILSNRASSNLHKIHKEWLRKLRSFFLHGEIKAYPQRFIQHTWVATSNVWQHTLVFFPVVIGYFLLQCNIWN